jgi:membrane protein implicated in regulation of membrane protease activity
MKDGNTDAILWGAAVEKGGETMTLDQLVKFVWLALLILFAAAEGISVGLTSIWFAAGALCALIVSLLGGPLWAQIVVFIVVSALCMLAVRPLAKKYLTPGIQPTNADRIIGQEALVTEDVDNVQGKGAVTIGGVVWSARSDGEEPIPAGTKVRVLRIEGVKVFVETVKEEVKCS